MSPVETLPRTVTSALDPRWEERANRRARLLEHCPERLRSDFEQIVRSIKPPADLGPHERQPEIAGPYSKHLLEVHLRIADMLKTPTFDRTLRFAPWDELPPASSHGGHEPTQQNVWAKSDGSLMIYTSILDGSSNVQSTAALGCTIVPIFPSGLLTVQPWINWADQHYLYAAGFGESHS